MDDFVLEFREVSKLFPGVVALDKVSFGVKRGAVHVLMGENGAGKSTLMKIISGEHEVTSGEILLDGEKMEFKNPQMAREKGIAMIYQELQYVPEFTVEEFLMMGREPGRKANCFIDWKELNRIEEACRLMYSNIQSRITGRRHLSFILNGGELC